MTSNRTLRLTTAQALVLYLSKQYSVADGHRRRLVPAAMGIFGHGNVAGLGQALDQYSSELPFVQGRNEQAPRARRVGVRQGRRGGTPCSPSRPRSAPARSTWSPAPAWRR